jgi:hypothetical protein
MTLQQSVQPAHDLPAKGSVGAGILSINAANLLPPFDSERRIMPCPTPLPPSTIAISY